MGKFIDFMNQQALKGQIQKAEKEAKKAPKPGSIVKPKTSKKALLAFGVAGIAYTHLTKSSRQVPFDDTQWGVRLGETVVKFPSRESAEAFVAGQGRCAKVLKGTVVHNLGGTWIQ